VVSKDEYIQSVYRVVFYIEKNSGFDLTLEELSGVAGFSKYHFHRIFKSVIGESLGDYVRRVRLASTTLKFKTKRKITQIAMDSGYETNASFSKAFKKHFGMSPKEFSAEAKKKKGNEMKEPKIVDMEKVRVLCVRKTGAYTESASEAWAALMQFAYTQRMKHKKNIMGKGTMHFGIGHDNPNLTEPSKMRYDACITIR